MSKYQFSFTESKAIITKSNLPDTDYVINPYIGCQFGCVYCYASFMGRFNKRSIAEWGEYVIIKSNAADLAEKELIKLKKTAPNSKILLSSVTDPYQAVEAKHKITRKILSIIGALQYSGMINILTKSPLVLRDVDVLKTIPQVEVGLTVTTTDDTLSKALELNAPRTSSRLKALRELNQLGLNTYAFIGPLLPHYALDTKQLENLFLAIKATGTRFVYIEYLNTKSYIKERMLELAGYNSILSKVYSDKNNNVYEDELKKIIMDLIMKYNFSLKLNEVISHNNLKEKKSDKRE